MVLIQLDLSLRAAKLNKIEAFRKEYSLASPFHVLSLFSFQDLNFSFGGPCINELC